ncbi:MAG: amidohydrolase family protein [Solirubrobacteraceae bacterium]
MLLPIRAEAPYGNRRYHPLLAAAARRRLVVGLHAWGRSLSAPAPPSLTRTHFEDYLSNQIIVQSHVLSPVSEGVFERLPELRVAVLECGFAWLPPLLWRFDKDWKGLWPEVPWVRDRPSTYLPRHFRFTTAPANLPSDPVEASELVAMVGPELLMYASDHPHRHGSSASALDAILDKHQLHHLYHANARSFYSLGREAARASGDVQAPRDPGHSTS